MRKTLVALLFLLLPFSLFSADVGYGISGKGFAGDVEETSLSVDVTLDISERGYGMVVAGAGVGFSNDELGLSELYVGISTNTFRTIHHPFGFMFFNKTLWSPNVAFHVFWDRGMDVCYRIRFSPLHFEDTSFTYEFLTPFVYFDDSFEYSGWGVELLRMGFHF